MRALDRLLSPEDIEKLRAGEVHPAELHFSIGMTLRNNWGLWRGSALARWFHRRGVHHPDDMSGMILTSYIRHLRGEPLAIEEQITEAKRYWEEAEAAEAAERAAGPERLARVRDAQMGWVFTDRDVPLVQFPDREFFTTDVPARRFERYAGGVVVLARSRTRDPRRTLWHDGVHFIASPEAELRPAWRRGCDDIHDVLTLGITTHWLCHSDGRWLLIHEQDGAEAQERLAINADALRLGSAGDELLVASETTLYRAVEGSWQVFHRSARPWLPPHASPPRLLGNHVYFLVDRDGLGMRLYRIDLGDARSRPEDGREFLLRPHYGSWAMSVENLVQSRGGELWATAGHRFYPSLFRIDERGVKIALFEGAVDSVPQYREGLLHHRPLGSDQIRRQVPATAVIEAGERLYLAGDLGIAVSTQGRVEPILRFDAGLTRVELDGAEDSRGPRAIAHFESALSGDSRPSFLLAFPPLVVARPDADGGYTLTRPAQGAPIALGFQDVTETRDRVPSSTTP